MIFPIGELYDFLISSGMHFTKDEILGFQVTLIRNKSLAVVPVDLETAEKEGKDMFAKISGIRKNLKDRGWNDVVFLYEDAWRNKGTLMRSRLSVMTGNGKNIYARNCEVRRLDKIKADRFLNENHFYGSSKAKYFLGLWRYRSTGVNEIAMGDTSNLVAVASFSALRNMDGIFSSQWERYASVKGCRVVGGMGKLLKAFEEIIFSGNPDIDEFGIMSYADLEWSDGGAYRKLGFNEKEYRDPVPFMVDEFFMERIHENKFSRDRKYRNLSPEKCIRIYNGGSLRFFKTISRKAHI